MVFTGGVKIEYDRIGVTYEIDELGEAKAQLDEDGVRVVGDGPYETVVIGEKVVIKAFGIRIGRSQSWDYDNKGQNPGSQHHTGTVHSAH